MRREFSLAETVHGRIRGLRDHRGHAFRGVPYGRSTAGAARLRPPQPPEPWSDVRDCTDWGPAAPQSNADLAMMGAADVMALLFDPPEWLVRSEDCLNLNVWTPALDGAKRPVMVWLHSGGFFSGTASTHKCAGANLAQDGDVVVVTVNHRLGLLGFMHLADLCGEDFVHSGNAGLLDMVAALQWVRDNIAAFGGDPGNVTLFGESGGGGKVNSLMMAPRARGLFHKAIVQSGPWLRYLTRGEAGEIGARALHHLGLDPARAGALRDLPLAAMARAQSAAMAELMARPVSLDGAQCDRAYGPVCDGDVIPRQPSEPAAFEPSRHVPLLIGTNQDEGTFMLSGDPEFPDISQDGLDQRMIGMFGTHGPAIVDAYRKAMPDAAPGEAYSAIGTDLFLRIPSITTAERRRAAGCAPVHMYRFAYGSSVLGGRLGATHGVEIPFVFGSVGEDPLAGTDPARFDLSAKVIAAWSGFARTGAPGHAGLPGWPAYDLDRRPVMRLGHDCGVEYDPGRATRLFWAGLQGGLAA